MATYVTDVLTATAATATGSPTPTRTWQWLRGSTTISGATTNSYTVTAEDLGQPVTARQTEANFLGTASATGVADGSVLPFTPTALFALNEPGVWYDPNDITTLYTDNFGTTPVTAPGQTVGMMLDKSKGMVLGPQLVTNGDFSNGITGWQGFTGATTLSNVSGTLQQVSIGTQANAMPTSGFATVVGRTYRLSYDVVEVGSGANSVKVFVGTTSGNSNNGTEGPPRNTTGTATAHFVAAGTTYFLTTEHKGPAGSVTRFDNISVQELPGNHATQSILGQRPTYGIVPKSGRRNILTWSESFDVTSAWDYLGVTVSPNLVDSPIGDVTADKLVENTANSDHVVFNDAPGIPAPAGSYTSSVYLKAAGRNFGYVQVAVNSAVRRYGLVVDLSTGAVTATNTLGTPTGTSYNVASAGNGWWRISATTTHVSGNIYFVSGPSSTGTPIYNSSGTPLYTGDGTSGILIWGAQLELGSTATAYQRVTTTFDVTEAGVTSVGYLAFDGIDKRMVTNIITPGTDKVQVFTGIRRTADTVPTSVIVEFSPETNTNNGSFYLLGPRNGSPNYDFTSKGTVFGDAVSLVNYPTLVSHIITGIGDISGDIATLRVNGSQVAQKIADQGAGNFLAYSIYIGARTASLPFNGHIYSLITRFGPNLSAARIAAMESWVSTKTPGVTL